MDSRLAETDTQSGNEDADQNRVGGPSGDREAPRTTLRLVLLGLPSYQEEKEELQPRSAGGAGVGRESNQSESG